MALATGYRWHLGIQFDWYRELGAREIHEQMEDGGWDDRRLKPRLAFLVFIARQATPSC